MSERYLSILIWCLCLGPRIQHSGFGRWNDKHFVSDVMRSLETPRDDVGHPTPYTHFAVISASSHTLCDMQSMLCLVASPLLWIRVWR